MLYRLPVASINIEIWISEFFSVIFVSFGKVIKLQNSNGAEKHPYLILDLNICEVSIVICTVNIRYIFFVKLMASCYFLLREFFLIQR